MVEVWGGMALIYGHTWSLLTLSTTIFFGKIDETLGLDLDGGILRH